MASTAEIAIATGSASATAAVPAVTRTIRISSVA